MSGQTRRAFTVGVAGLFAGFALEACAGGGGAAPSPYAGQLRIAALAAALENQAVAAYQAIDAAMSAGKLGPTIPALAAFVQAAKAHHVQHAATWNAILSDAHKPTITGTPLTGNAQLMSTISGAQNVDAAVAAIQRLELQAAQTYAAAIEHVTGLASAVSAAATIAPVEAMHAAALGYVFGGQSAVVGFLGTGAVIPTTALTA